MIYKPNQFKKFRNINGEIYISDVYRYFNIGCLGWRLDQRLRDRLYNYFNNKIKPSLK